MDLPALTESMQMPKTRRTFWEVRSWSHEVIGKRIPNINMAFDRACDLTMKYPGHAFYVTQSLGQFKDGVYTPW
jgi:hypothetical protein